LKEDNATKIIEERDRKKENNGTILDEFESFFSTSLIEGSLKTPTVASVTVEKKGFLSNLSKLKQIGYKFSGMLALPDNIGSHRIKYFLTIDVEDDMEILVVIGVDLDSNEEMDSIKDIFPAGIFFERELKARGVRFQEKKQALEKLEENKIAVANDMKD
jgi:Ni,Fe-hydrogenase III component G